MKKNLKGKKSGKKRSSKRNSNKNRNQKSKMKLKTIKKKGSKRNSDKNRNQKSKMKLKTINIAHIGGNFPYNSNYNDNNYTYAVPNRFISENCELFLVAERKTIACGFRFNVAIQNDGTGWGEAGSLKAWGDNTHHQLDNVPEGNDYIGVACGATHSVALKYDGTIRTWGDNSMGQLNGVPDWVSAQDKTRNSYGRLQSDRYYAIACGLYHSMAIVRRAPGDCDCYQRILPWEVCGSIKCWGLQQPNNSVVRGERYTPPEGDNYVAIACGNYHNVALTDDGIIKCWITKNLWDQDNARSRLSVQDKLVENTLIDSPTDIEDFDPEGRTIGYVMIACGSYHSVALKNDGTIKCWGDNSYNQLNRAPTDNGYIKIACGGYHSVALKYDGTIKCWGNNKQHQLDIPRDNGYIMIACGFSHSLALKNDGTVKSWGGRDSLSQLNVAAEEGKPTDSSYIDIACGKCWNQPPTSELSREFLMSPTRGLEHPDNISSINISHSLVLKRDGTIKCWGRNFLQDNRKRDGNYLDLPNGSANIPRGFLTKVSENNLENIRDNKEAMLETFDTYREQYPPSHQPTQLPSVTMLIDRKNVFESLKTHIQDNGSDFFNKGTYIKFLGEDGIDQGGLTREFFALLSKELQEDYFQVYHNDISSIGKEQEEHAEAKDIEDYYIIGQMFAYAIKSKNNINIKLNPIILDFLINSEPVEDLDITKTEFGLLLDMFDDTLSAENIEKIQKLINDEIKHKKRHHSNLDTLQKVKKIFNDYDPNILSNFPYNAFLTLNESDWTNNAKICLDEPGATCVTYENYLDVPFTKKDIYLLFIIKNFAFTRCIAEFYKFIEGFDSIIQLDKLKQSNVKQLNKLIIGDRSLNIDDFLRYLLVEDTDGKNLDSSKSSLVKDFITEESKKKDDYLNKLLYLITASESLPFNGWDSFKEREFRIVFVKNIDSVRSHTCDGFKYVEIPESVLEGTNEEIKEKLNTVLSYDSVVASSQSAICMAGGRIKKIKKSSKYLDIL